jgi:hypothetical protein
MNAQPNAHAAFERAKNRLLQLWESPGHAGSIHDAFFVGDNQLLQVYLFLETDAEVEEARRNGNDVEAETIFRDEFGAEDLDPADIARLHFEIDSHEDVQKNFKGSYFFRLR